MKRLALLSLSLAFAVGCGGSTNPPTEPVTGTVTLDGKAVEGAYVTFVADDSANQSAVGVTSAEGKFALTTFDADDGAMAGSYSIMITKFDTPDGGASPYGDAGGDPVISDDMSEAEADAARDDAYGASAEDMQKSQKAGAKHRPKNELPAWYAATSTSGFKATVPAGGTDVPLELSSKKKR